jgi:pyruvate/2-oxoglutarate dehydrogenase complex dihydrolipoamide dehydrogenase (E3) component
MNGRSLHPDAVLFAAGRSVNTNSLGLEEAGVEMDKLGRIKVDRDYKTTADGIYAAGDVRWNRDESQLAGSSALN